MPTTREKPMTFSGWSVRRIRANDKTQTRRLAKLNELLLREEYPEVRAAALKAALSIAPYQPGDICYIQEPYQIIQCGLDDMQRRVFGVYLADSAEFNVGLSIPEWERLCRRKHPFRSSSAMFMYHSLARDRLRILKVGAQQIQQISEEDALAEGLVQTTRFGAPAFGLPGWIMDDYVNVPTVAFRHLWDSLHAHNGNGWDKNRWVFAYEFERLRGDP